jgi:uncharacterized protein (DUF4415 family)
MPQTSKKRTIKMPSRAEDRRITAAAKADPDAQPWTKRQLDAIPPELLMRGRPKSGYAKQLVSIRFSPEVLAYFKDGGEGWQTRLNKVLVDYVKRRTG